MSRRQQTQAHGLSVESWQPPAQSSLAHQSLIETGPFCGLQRAHYGLLMADPPWRFLTRSKKGLGRAPQAHYACMDMGDIAAMPVSDLAAPDAMLLMWTIDTHLDQALSLIKAWDFTFKTIGFVWAKINKNADETKIAEEDWFMGMGYWTRANTEICLLATRGRPKRLSRSVRRFIPAKIREHSRKPDEAYARAQRLVGGPYLELFARTERPGWTAFGNEVHKFADEVMSKPKRTATSKKTQKLLAA